MKNLQPKIENLWLLQCNSPIGVSFLVMYFSLLTKKNVLTLQKIKIGKVMSRELLQNLGNYLLGTLTKDDTAWLIQYLMESSHQRPLRPYTMEEINAMIDESERQIANGEYFTSEEVFKELAEEELELEAV